MDANAAAALAEGGGDGWATLTAGTGTGRLSATFAVIDGEYPRVKALWPAEVTHTLTHTIEVTAAPLAAAARQLDALQEKNRPVALHLTPIHDADAVTVTTYPAPYPTPPPVRLCARRCAPSCPAPPTETAWTSTPP